jgi:GTP cyclohydrolase II
LVTLRFATGEAANHGVDLKTENREERVLFGPSAEIRAAVFVATSSCFFNSSTGELFNTSLTLLSHRLLQKWRRSHTRYNDGVSNPEIEQVASADFPTRWGKFRIYGFRGHSTADGDRRVEEAVALVMGDLNSRPPLVRVHSQCLTGDVFHSLRCDCRQQLELSLSMMAEEAAGILIYEQQEGRGIGLMAKLQAYELQDAGLDTVEANERLGFKADHRDFTLPGEILKALGVRKVRLLSNNPEKVEALERSGVRVVERVPCEVTPSPHAEEYLRTKKEKLGHLFTSS